MNSKIFCSFGIVCFGCFVLISASRYEYELIDFLHSDFGDFRLNQSGSQAHLFIVYKFDFKAQLSLSFHFRRFFVLFVKRKFVRAVEVELSSFSAKYTEK